VNKSYSDFIIEQQVLQEKLITFGGKAYPKFGQVVILAGGAGSGKGFTLKTLLGIEGKVFDVDEIKKAVQNSVKAKAMVKKDLGVDVSTLNLKDPENVRILHGILAQTKLLKGGQNALFADLATLQGKSDRLPNLIFDVTLKDADKLSSIHSDVTAIGYKKEDIHLVWVINDIAMAQDQNATRDRVVPEDILLKTHVGASKTVLDLIQDSSNLRKYMDGDVWFSFNKFKVDSMLAKSSDIKPKDAESSGVLPSRKVGQGSYVTDTIIIKVKAKGKSTNGKGDISKRLLRKIKEYIPNSSEWVGKK
tara:strand:+ start:127 stop:1041 length:915 start_codon:yes stop_codon:yes gene_type:complete